MTDNISKESDFVFLRMEKFAIKLTGRMCLIVKEHKTSCINTLSSDSEFAYFWSMRDA